MATVLPVPIWNRGLTVDFWFRQNGSQGQNNLIGWGGPGAYTTIYTGGTGQPLNVYAYAGGSRIVGSTGITADVWHHIAVTRASGNLRLFLDGVQEGSTYTDSTNYGLDTFEPRIGGYRTSPAVGGRLDGWIDEVRILVGTAVRVGSSHHRHPRTVLAVHAIPIAGAGAVKASARL
jgi:hypothetical protein